MTDILLDAAVYYSELGYPVFPCRPGAKTPVTGHGFKDSSSEPSQIETWWKKTPSANVAVPTQGLLVIDIDGPGSGRSGAPPLTLQMSPR